MKTKYALLLLLAAGLTLTACSGDEIINPYAHESTIKVEKSELDFPSKGGTGSVTVNVSQGITAKSSVDWATLSISGSQIAVTCTENSDANGRNGLITIHHGADSTQVSVHQLGLSMRLDIPQNIVLNDDAVDKTFPLTHTNAVEVSTKADWITATVAESTLTLHIKENTTGDIRMAEVTVKSGTLPKTFKVTQISLNSFLHKTFFFLGGGMATGLGYTGFLEAELVKDEKGLFLQTTLPFDNKPTIKIPVGYNESNYALSFSPSPTPIGQVDLTAIKAGTPYVFIGFKNSGDAEGKPIFDPAEKMEAIPEIKAPDDMTWVFNGKYTTLSIILSESATYTESEDNYMLDLVIPAIWYYGNLGAGR